MDPRPFHILSYGTLLGTQVFQSFIGGIIAFRRLSRPQFATLQTGIFPIYFGLQTALPVVIALTAPSSQGGVTGVLHADNRYSTLFPLATAFVAGVINLLVMHPLVTKTMRERKAQETRDGKKSYDPPPHSKEMLSLNKKFGKLHGLSSLVNLISIAATAYYGVVLSKRLS